MKYFLQLWYNETAKVLHLMKFPFIAFSIYVKKVKENTKENEGYAIGITINLLWIQLVLEFVVWEKWRI